MNQPKIDLLAESYLNKNELCFEICILFGDGNFGLISEGYYKIKPSCSNKADFNLG